ncbi:MAG: transposase family protein [Thermoanaerobaculia bacterium]
MSNCYCEHPIAGLPAEDRLLEEVAIELITPEERERFDLLMENEHYLRNATAVGQVLRYVAGYRGQWVALLTFCSAALHLKFRDRLLDWSPRQVSERRHLIAQNSRFLILPSTGKWPNLASRVLKLACDRLGQDWQEHFGHPVLLAETFVDPQRYRGTCYKAAGWQPLGQTKGFERSRQDFYVDQEHPKELWVRALGRHALALLRAKELAPELRNGHAPPPPLPPVSTDSMSSFWEFARQHLVDPRKARGQRHLLPSIVTLAALAIASGCQGPHAIGEFAKSLNHGQRRQLRFRRIAGTRHQFEVPCERTFERLFKVISCDQLRAVYSQWMATLDPEATKVLHLDGKVIKNADPAPARLQEDPALVQAAACVDTPTELQKPKAEKALMLVNFQTPSQRLIDQIAVPQDTNEEAAVAAHLPKMDLAGVLVIGDAAHTVKANCRLITQEKGGDYLCFLKKNQPNALAKAQQLLPGAVPPSGSVARQGPRSDRATLPLGHGGGCADPGPTRSGADLPDRPESRDDAVGQGH